MKDHMNMTKRALPRVNHRFALKKSIGCLMGEFIGGLTGWFYPK